MNESSSFDSLGHTAVQVWDPSWQEDAQRFNVYGAHRYFPYDNGVPPLFTIDTVLEQMETCECLMKTSKLYLVYMLLVITQDATYMGNAAGNAVGRLITYGRHAGRVAASS